MSGGGSFIDDAAERARWEGFQWTAENAKAAKEIIARYPEGRQMSASIPLLDLAQRQVGAETNTQGWLPIPVMEFVGRELDMPYVRVLEVATFYTMFNLAPVGGGPHGLVRLHRMRLRRNPPSGLLTKHDPSAELVD